MNVMPFKINKAPLTKYQFTMCNGKLVLHVWWNTHYYIHSLELFPHKHFLMGYINKYLYIFSYVFF